MSRSIFVACALCVLGVLLFLAWKTMNRRRHWPAVAMMAAASYPAVAQGPTVINVSQNVLHKDVKRLGMNLGGENYYNSLQLLKNLVSRNPGFEGQQWQTVLQCGKVTPTSCTDGGNSGMWPEGFLDGGTFEVISGAAMGKSGPILHSTAGNDKAGATIQFAAGTAAPATNDFIVVRKTTPGNATAGWQAQVESGATVTTEFKDLSPRSPGSQAVRISASGPNQYAALKQYFDSGPYHAYVRMQGPYTIRFRAKNVRGGKAVRVVLERLAAGGNESLFQQDVTLTPNWQDYTLNFNAAEPENPVGTVAFSITAFGSELLLDDVSLSETTPNGTAFRNDVVATLQRLRPQVLRYMDSGVMWGSSLDNMLAPEVARKRTGYNRYVSESDDIPIGLPEFLTLCQKIGAEPWYSMQIGWSEEEATNLMEYLGGPATTKYGAIRAALGHPVPWTEAFPTIHIEFGNEAWNTAQPGETLPDPVAYAARTTVMFRTMRASPWYAGGHFNFIANTQSVNTWLTTKILENIDGIDMVDIAPYTFNTFGDDSSIEHIFGPMFAEPQMMDSWGNGIVRAQVNAAAHAPHPVKVAVYETNIDTTVGVATQPELDATVPSVGAGIASIDHMLLMLRDLGITVQNTFQLAGGPFPYGNSAGRGKDEASPIWGVVLDMGGATRRVRPSFLAQQLANEAIKPTMLATTITGTDPTWDQPKSANDDVELGKVHELQSFAFSDEETSTLILLNLSRTTAHSVGLAGDCAPQGTVKVRTLSSGKITDGNELEDKVRIVSRDDHGVVPGKATFSLAPFSMTTLTSARGSSCKFVESPK